MLSPVGSDVYLLVRIKVTTISLYSCILSYPGLLLICFDILCHLGGASWYISLVIQRDSEGFPLLFAVKHFLSSAWFTLASIINVFFYQAVCANLSILDWKEQLRIFMAVGHLPLENSQVGSILFCSQLLDCQLHSRTVALVFFSTINFLMKS